MSGQNDIDRLLRAWLDEGELTAPERHIWAALERTQTTRQRGTLRVSLEERVMRISPIAAIAAVVIVGLLGLALYLGVTGGPNVGPSASPSDAAGLRQTDRFSIPLAYAPIGGWTIIEDSHAAALNAPTADGSVAERVTLLRRSTSTIWSGIADGPQPWPDDLESWLGAHPIASDPDGPGSATVTVRRTSQREVAGESATVIETDTSFTPGDNGETSLNFAYSGDANRGADVLLLDGTGRMTFVVVEPLDLVIVYHAREPDFSPERFDVFLDSLALLDA